MIDAQITFLPPVSFLLPFPTFSDRVCQQQGLSLWVPFQNAATAVTNLYKGKDNLAALPIRGRAPASGGKACVPSVLAAGPGARTTRVFAPVSRE